MLAEDSKRAFRASSKNIAKFALLIFLLFGAFAPIFKTDEFSNVLGSVSIFALGILGFRGMFLGSKR